MSVLPRTLPLAVLAAALAAGPALAQDDTIRQYQLERDGDAYRLVMKEVAQPVPGEQEVLVRVWAVSLNRRDRSFQERGSGSMTGLVPVGDGAGEVIALGPGVTRFQLGDRVAGTFYERGVEPRIRGAAADAYTRARELARGGRAEGFLSEMIVSHEDGLVTIPDHLTFEELP